MCRGILLAALLAAFSLCGAYSASAQYPPLTTEISPDHPLFIFSVPAAAGDGAAYATAVSEAWEHLAEPLRPFSVLLVDAPPAPAGERVLFYHALLEPVQAAGIPVVIDIDGESVSQHLRPDELESLFKQYTVIRGAETRTPRWDVYPRPNSWPGTNPDDAVLLDWMERCARYGRFLHLPLRSMQWPRLMSAPHAKPVYDKMLAAKGYVLPGVWARPRTGAWPAMRAGITMPSSSPPVNRARPPRPPRRPHRSTA
jgi:hypothetical protein